ncbi:unnamed protein product [Periconia digitata]|uniref:Uncharacterized protein n=1 Tax=Periconia digitata TaxID=1303443 RepID=A0A9W4UF30_9PLEO|nr:unnamed protein product [Periconia digitata]
MALKIAVVGDINGQFPALFTKLASVHAKNKFAFAIVAGNLFANPVDATEKDEANVSDLIGGKIAVPFTTYFALGTNPLPEAVKERLRISDDELCDNLHFLGKRATMKTSEGVRIVSLGGQLDPNINSGQSKGAYLPYYSESDCKLLRGASSADILVTGDWPMGIRSHSKVTFNPENQPLGQQCIADLDVVLKPRYHFSTSGPNFYEREPFFHLPSEETDNLYPITRFISLAAYGNASKQKWIYAFSLDPKASDPVSAPSGSTICPLVHSENRKRPAPPHRDTDLVYDNGSRPGQRSHKRRKFERRGPIDDSQCFFCLSNENVATHLVTSLGDNSYMTTAKGPLSTPATFPKLGFPCHLLIIPYAHTPTFASMEEEERHSTYTEMQQYRASMNKMLKARAGEEYGSVTWEISRPSLPHGHWQYMPVHVDLIREGVLEAAFETLASNYEWPAFTKEDVKDGIEETGNFFRVLIWDPQDEANAQTSLILRFDESVHFHVQFGREVLAKLLRLDERLDWKECGQSVAEEKQDVATFKEAFEEFDFTEKR